jgi:cytochrome c oxidase cbb3-type subunit 3
VRSLLYIQGKATFTPGKTMGHVWDETLEEYNNPMPKWWSWLFVLTVVFALVYLVLYPGLGDFKGVLGWSRRAAQIEVEKWTPPSSRLFDKYLAMDVKAVAADKQAMEMGKRLYLTYCMQCHGADARGAKGFPNLTDSDWQYGGEPEQIKESHRQWPHGHVMPPHEQLGADTIKDLANFVRSLSGLPNDSVRAAKGKEAFASAGCLGCHGAADGKGMHAVGAPNLTDKVWLYGSSEATITETINKGRQNKMPAWQEFLGDAKIHLLTAYVYSLSQGAK